jgi:hypothetical protein
MTLREWWGRVASSKYTRGLEAEVARLRDENRALLNSILGIAGVPPVMVTAAEAEGTTASASTASAASAAAGTNAKAPVRAARSLTAGKSAAPGPGQSTGPVMRRRSWQQIYRMLEMDSARKKEAGEIV